MSSLRQRFVSGVGIVDIYTDACSIMDLCITPPQRSMVLFTPRNISYMLLSTAFTTGFTALEVEKIAGAFSVTTHQHFKFHKIV